MFFIERTNNKGYALNPYEALNCTSCNLNLLRKFADEWSPRARNKRKISAAIALKIG
jgi:ribosomal protein L40E